MLLYLIYIMFAGHGSIGVGDSGGPLAQAHGNFPYYTQIGITSTGHKCGAYAIFTRVSSYLDSNPL